MGFRSASCCTDDPLHCLCRARRGCVQQQGLDGGGDSAAHKGSVGYHMSSSTRRHLVSGHVGGATAGALAGGLAALVPAVVNEVLCRVEMSPGHMLSSLVT